jgi:hypothetical protein
MANPTITPIPQSPVSPEPPVVPSASEVPAFEAPASEAKTPTDSPKKLIRVELNKGENKEGKEFILTFEDGSQMEVPGTSSYLDGLKGLPYDSRLARVGAPVPISYGEETRYAVTLNDGSLRIVDSNSPYLLEFIENSAGSQGKGKKGEVFFIRGSSIDGEGDSAIFWVSPVASVSSDNTDARSIQITVSKFNSDGIPNPTYEEMVGIMKAQECDFVKLILFRNVVTDPPNSYRIWAMPEAPHIDFPSDDPKRYDPKSWYSTRAVTYGELSQVCGELGKEAKDKDPNATVLTPEGGPLWVFNAELKDAVDRYGQYRVYQEITVQLDHLRDSENFRDFIAKDFEKSLIANAADFGLDAKDTMEHADRMKMKTDTSLEELLQGREVVHVVMPDGSVKLQERKRTYNLGLAFKDQMDLPDPRLSPQQQRENAMAQLVNYSAQAALQKRLVRIAMEENIVLKGNEELVQAKAIPMLDPYRTPEALKVLSAEYAEMISANFINGIMMGNAALPPPGVGLDAFQNENSNGSKMMKGVEEELRARKVGGKPNLEQILAAANAVAVKKLRTNRLNEVVEAVKTGFAPGYLPEEIRKNKLMDLKARQEMWSKILAPTFGGAVHGVLAEAETIGIFR